LFIRCREASRAFVFPIIYDIPTIARVQEVSWGITKLLPRRFPIKGAKYHEIEDGDKHRSCRGQERRHPLLREADRVWPVQVWHDPAEWLRPAAASREQGSHPPPLDLSVPAARPHPTHDHRLGRYCHTGSGAGEGPQASRRGRVRGGSAGEEGRAPREGFPEPAIRRLGLPCPEDRGEGGHPADAADLSS